MLSGLLTYITAVEDSKMMCTVGPKDTQVVVDDSNHLPSALPGREKQLSETGRAKLIKKNTPV